MIEYNWLHLFLFLLADVRRIAYDDIIVHFPLWDSRKDITLREADITYTKALSIRTSHTEGSLRNIEGCHSNIWHIGSQGKRNAATSGTDVKKLQRPHLRTALLGILILNPADQLSSLWTRYQHITAHRKPSATERLIAEGMLYRNTIGQQAS